MRRAGKRLRLLCLVPALLLVWQGCERLLEGWQIAPLAAYVHAEWWGRGAAPPLTTVLAVEPGRADGRAWSAYGQAALTLAERSEDKAARARYLDMAEAATRKALRLGPAQAAAWARLALISVNRAEPDLAALALARSLALAPAWPRVKLGLYLRPLLGGPARAGIAADVARLWQQPPSAGLPYPRAALRRYAEEVGRGALVTALLQRQTMASVRGGT
jgi:hypothetical protein